MRVGRALKLICVGFGLGVLLRVVQMLYFFDYETGFYTDGGVMAWLSLGLPLAASLAAAVLCYRSRRYFGPYIPRRNVLVGVIGLLSGAALVISGVLRLTDLDTVRAENERQQQLLAQVMPLASSRREETPGCWERPPTTPPPRGSSGWPSG